MMESVLEQEANDSLYLSITSDDFEFQQSLSDRCFLLMDAKEILYVTNGEIFCKRLKCPQTAKIKVVTIFGNVGAGKSHTMNNVFFKGEEVFKTSPEQNSCTLGVYAAMQHDLGVLCLDTEGLLSTSSPGNKRMRMLLKILAISDVIIYRSRSERLHSDMFHFLGAASEAFCKYFSEALQSLSMEKSTNLGPAVIVFHETSNTEPLQNTGAESAENKLREDFLNLNYNIKAFSSLRYVGTQTLGGGKTDFSSLISALYNELDNTTVRSPRSPNVIFEATHALNKQFSGEINENFLNPFPEQFFTCPILCVSCNRRCQRSMGHDGESHYNSQPCQHQHQLENKVELCKMCYNNGREVVVSRIDGWTQSIINCPHCGELTRAFKYWSGTQDSDVIRTQTIHVWKDSNLLAKGPMHSGQMVLDKVSYVCEAFTNFSSQPTGAIMEWCADKVAPKYWKSNNEIIRCFACKKNFEKTGLRKHHCRGCGEGFCDACTQHRLPVPARKWFDQVRVCADCHQQLLKNPDIIPVTSTLGCNNTEETDVTVRKCGETLYNTVSKVASAAIECTKEIIKDTARPDYWVPDAEALCCHICKIQFGTAEELALTYISNNTSQAHKKSYRNGDCKRHHCRKCGQGVCAECSLTRKPVPDRGWLDDVRICDECVKDMPALPSSATSDGNSLMHSGQMMLDKVSHMCEFFKKYSSQHSETLKDLCADMVAPKYWKSNNDIIHCAACLKNFEKTGLSKHHCRGCGEGFCDACTQYRLPVPAYNWFSPVRVCSYCHDQLLKAANNIPATETLTDTSDTEEVNDVKARKFGEVLYKNANKITTATVEYTKAYSFISTYVYIYYIYLFMNGYALEYTKDILKNAVRPDYWVPDAEAVCCHICESQFGTADELALIYIAKNTPTKKQKAFKGGECKRHHCRKCGKGVCADCSLTRKPVPDRGWLNDVRICDECVKEMSFSCDGNSHQDIKSTLDDSKTKVE